MRICAFFLVMLFFMQSAQAQNTYKPWSNPDTSAAGTAAETRLQILIQNLKALVDKAEKARAADPAFLQDLRSLTETSSPPAVTLILSDDFSDGNFEANPAWQVTAGEYWIEKGWGLRSAITAEAQTTSTQTSRQTNKDAAAALFGQILSQALGGKQTTATQQASAPTQAVIHTSVKIPNAFTVQASISSWTAEGRLELAMYQGNFTEGRILAGYRLAYIPGGKMELVRVSTRGSTIMNATTLAKPLEDKKFHSVEWRRKPNGHMTVRIDGIEALSATDLGFRDPFNGLTLMNKGGDYILKQVQITENQ